MDSATSWRIYITYHQRVLRLVENLWPFVGEGSYLHCQWVVGEEWVSRGRPSHTCKEEEWTLVFQGLLGRPKHVADRSYELCVGEKVRDITIKLWEKLRKLSSEAVRLSGPRWDVHEEDPILTATERQATSSWLLRPASCSSPFAGTSILAGAENRIARARVRSVGSGWLRVNIDLYIYIYMLASVYSFIYILLFFDIMNTNIYICVL